MGIHSAEVRWDRQGARFIDGQYPRAHRLIFDGGAIVPASSSPAVVPPPLSDPAGVDPEEAFLASLASCHMLWFLSIAAKRGHVVDSYADCVSGVLAKNAIGKRAIVRVTLRPTAEFSGAHRPTEAAVREMHHEAHQECFIANSVTSEIDCIPQFADGD